MTTARSYIVLDLPPSSEAASNLLNQHAAFGWEVVGTLTWGNGDAGVIMARHTTRHQEAMAAQKSNKANPVVNPDVELLPRDTRGQRSTE